MNVFVDEALAAEYRNVSVTIEFKSGHELKFPIDGNPRLEQARLEDLNQIELSPFGIHWPRLDEDLSFEGIMRDDYGQR